MTLADAPSTSGRHVTHVPRRIRGLWWLSPSGAVVLLTLPTLALAHAFSDTQFRTAWRSAKWLSGDFALLLAFGAMIFSATALAALFLPRTRLGTPWPGLTGSDRRLLHRLSGWIFWLCLAGYAFLLIAGLRRGATPQVVLSVLTGTEGSGTSLKELFAPVAGVTTLTQFGPAYVVIALTLRVQGPVPALARRLAVVGTLAALRGFLLNERLALLEILIPALAIAAMAAASGRRRWPRTAVRWAPVVFIPATIVFFGLFEYWRSWTFYSLRSSGSFAEFVLLRLTGYYVTAYNNGALAWQFERTPGRLPYRTLELVWTAPGIEQAQVYERLSPVAAPDLGGLLSQYANPEYNSPCGLCDPFVDWGPWGGAAFLAVAGLLLGTAYVLFTNGRVVAVLVYPILVTGLYELPRYLYWSQGRALPALASLAFAGILVRRARSPFRRRSSQHE